MTGISGWYAEDLANIQLYDATSRMSASLPSPGETQRLIGARSALACRLDRASTASNPDAGLYVAIEGEPRWSSRHVAKMANSDGNGAALISAYQSLGLSLFQEISGPFALAVIDERAGDVVLAVDRMGIRPMCYALNPNGDPVFGSTANAILAHSQMRGDLSSQSIYNYVYFHVVPSPSTVFKNISKLEPGQFVHFNTGSVRKKYYWTPQFDKVSRKGADTLQNELLLKMRSAVANARHDERTGAFLSGGLDSSTVCGLANEITAQPLTAYSIGFAQQGYDEIEYARIAANHFGLTLREYYVTPDDIAEAIPIIATTYDEPFGNSSAVPAYFCARLAKDDGMQCLLAGDGGDELFAGNERYATQQLFEYYSRIPAALRKSFLEPAIFGLPMNWSGPTHKIRRYVEQARTPMPERLQTYNYLHMNDPYSVFESEFLSDVNTRGPIEDMAIWYLRGNNFGLVDRMLMFDWKLTLADNDIRKVNRMCEAAGISVHYPLLDDTLVSFSTGIPAKLKLRRRKLRYFFKMAVDDVLPREIINKQKHGFGLPFGEWLNSSDRLQEIVARPLRA